MLQTVCSSWKDNIEQRLQGLWKQLFSCSLYAVTATLRVRWQQITAFRGAWALCVEVRARRT
jgi:hypothetical protein